MVPQEVEGVISLSTVLASLEEGQDQNDEKLQGENSVSGDPVALRVASQEKKICGQAESLKQL